LTVNQNRNVCAVVVSSYNITNEMH